jgi:hypothetical protein
MTMSAAADPYTVPAPRTLYLVENDNGAPANGETWDGHLPYGFDVLSQVVVSFAKDRGGLGQDEVAKLIGVSRQRVSEIERKALLKLKKYHGAWLADFLLDAARSR